MADRESMEFNDFRVVTSSSVYRKGSTAGGVVSQGGQAANRYRYTLGEVCSTNITLDVNVGTGWTRIRLKEVPKFIVHAFNMISKYGLEVDGIFRKEGNSARLNRAEVQNIYKGQCDIPNDYTVIDVCTLVKRFLRDLKPPLLDSDEFRQRLLKKACQARISNSFVLTRDEMADMCYTDDATKDRQTKDRQIALLSDIHFSTLGYVMRQLNRISAHCDSHKMSIENLAVVLVGSVFGDGIHTTTKKSNQMRRGSQDDILAQKKQDMNVHVAAVKLLITNANLIGVRRDPYVASNAMLRSSSAMPRCMSSGYETCSSDADCVSSRTATLKSSAEGGPSSFIHRRDSEAAHKIVTSRKKTTEQMTKKKRSASFLPSFRDIRHRLTNMKRAKSPSPERLTTGHSAEKTTDTTSSSDTQNSMEPQLIHRKKVARNESNTMSTGSTASGRQSRSQQSRRGNTNAAPRGIDRSAPSKPTISKLFDGDIPIVSSGGLRRLSASDQNSDAIRFAKHRLSNEQMSVTEFLMSEHEREKETISITTSTNRIQKRNTMVLGETSKSSATKHTNRRHTAPINNNRLRRNRPNTVGAGLPQQQRRDTLTGSSSLEEKENQADCETDDTLEQTLIADQSKWLLEQKAMEARSRRAGRKQKAAMRQNASTDSLVVLNGSMAAEAKGIESKEEKPEQHVILRKDVEEIKKKQLVDVATSPLVLDTPKKSILENGHVWVGTKQIVTVTPSPSLVRRQSRARLSYSKATESPMDMPSSSSSSPHQNHLASSSSSGPRPASPLMMSPVLRHVTVNNNSPPSHVITTVSPRSHVLSPLVLKMDKSSPPPPIPPHSPPTLTPHTSKSDAPRRRPPTPPSHPKMSNPFSPKLPIRSVTIDNGFELPEAAVGPAPPVFAAPAPPGLFKLPQLPKKISGSQLSPLARQPQSMSTLSVPNRGNLRETKSIDTADTVPLRSAPLTASRPPSGQLSPRSSEYFEFGKYTNLLRSAKDEFALPIRKQSVEPRPSVAIIRSNNCGLVRSRVNHFQEIEQMQRNETSLSGRASQLSLRSSDTQDRYSDFSDSRHNLTSSESVDTPATPTATTTSRSSYDPVHHF